MERVGWYWQPPSRPSLPAGEHPWTKGLSQAYMATRPLRHSSLLFAFSLAVVLLSLGCSILVNGQDASKADCFGLLGVSIIQGISGQVPSAPISRKRSTPSPLPGQLTQFTLIQVRQHLDVWDLVQPVLDDLQMGHLITTTHVDVNV